MSVRAPRARELRSRRSALLSALKHLNSFATLVGGVDLSWRAVALNNVSVVYSAFAGLETTRDQRGEWLRKAVEAVEEAVRIRHVLGVQGDLASSLNNVSSVYSDLAGLETTREGRGAWLRKAVEAVEEAVLIDRELGVRGDLAMSLNNVSNRYSDLAGLETTREGRGEWLRKAVDAVEESVRIRREQSVQGDLAISLNNVSIHYSGLAGLETTREGQGEWLRKSVDAVEEAVRICRELGVWGDVAISLSNVLIRYSDLAGLETTRESRGEWLRKAVDAVEESVRIHWELGVQGDLASSLNSVSNHYSDLAGLETTQEGRGEWLRKALEAVEEAVRIRRELGVQGNLAMSLNNVSNRYSDLAGLEKTQEGRGQWLRKAVEAVEEAVRIYRELGVQGDLAGSLNNVSNRYSTLAELETARECRGEWLRKAVEAVEEAVRMYRELGVQGNLATSLGANSQIRRNMAENADDPHAALEDLRASRSAIGEAVELFRESGNTPYLLLALREVVISDLLLVQAGYEVDATAVRSACATGLELARSMQDEAKVAFFGHVLGNLDPSDEPVSTSAD